MPGKQRKNSELYLLKIQDAVYEKNIKKNLQNSVVKIFDATSYGLLQLMTLLNRLSCYIIFLLHLHRFERASLRGEKLKKMRQLLWPGSLACRPEFLF